MKPLILSVLMIFGAIGLQAQGLDPVYSLQGVSTDSIDPNAYTFNPGPSNSNANQSTFNGHRVVHFVHGLGGSSKSWNLAADSLERNYRLFSNSVDYNNATNGTLASAAKELNDEIDLFNLLPRADTIARRRNLLIGHSQGGLVAKALDFEINRDSTLFPPQFGGIVTFGTPHGGAMLLNNGDPQGQRKWVQSFVREGCEAVTEAKARDFLAKRWVLSAILDLVNASDLPNTITEAACGAFSNTALPLLLNDLAQPITTDYNVGSPAVNRLNNYQTNTPIITFFGDETQPVFFRTLSSFQINMRDLAKNPFGADDDESYVRSANQMMSHFNSKVFYHQSNVRRLKNKLIRNRKKIKASEEAQKANRRAFRWFHSANDQWQIIIGATLVDTLSAQYSCFCAYRGSHSPFGPNAAVPLVLASLRPDPNATCDNTPQTAPIYRFSLGLGNNVCMYTYYDNPMRTGAPLFAHSVFGANCPLGPSAVPQVFNFNRVCQQMAQYDLRKRLRPSDGVITAETATAYPAAIARIRMPNTNHQQMRNSSETEEAFEDIFLGNIPNSFQFHINIR